MQIQEIAVSLSPLERTVVKHLSLHNSFEDLVKKTGLKDVEVMRAIQWLQNKSVIYIESFNTKVVVLGENGKKYVHEGLPEKKILEALLKDFKLKLSEVAKKTGLNEQEINACIGILRSKLAIETSKDDELILQITEQGKKLLQEGFPEERFIRKLRESSGINEDSIKDLEKLAFDNLKKRKDIIKVEEKTSKIIIVEKNIDLELLRKSCSSDFIETLTPEMIKSGEYKGKKFRAYDVKSDVPKIYGGKRHFVNQSIDYGRKIWLEMGFKEMTGTKAVSSFWNFDALFTAQDHPVREMHDTFFIKGVKARLPEKKIVEAVKNAHEKGVGRSKGWRYLWNEETAKRVLIRTHTTALSSQALAKLKKEDLPAKFFAIGKCFRNETIDWKHGFEFNQTEGIVIDPDANLRNLIGYLTEFAKKMGFEKVKFQPSFFPYTEPSIEGMVFNKEKGEWIEVFAAGIFRPEVTIPLLGTYMPVLAWGPGFDRLMMMAYEIVDMRELYANNIKTLRNKPFWRE